MVTMGNEIIPPIAACANANIFLCQFPFPMNRPLNAVDKAVLGGYETIIVYSEYARSHVYAGLSACQLPVRTIKTVYPPVPQIAGSASRKKRIILSVGRFFTSGHSKRHDALITAFKTIASQFDGPVELHLAGSSAPGEEHMDYLASLKVSAEGYPVHFHVNASVETLTELYRDAAVYWHGTGIGVNMAEHPDKAEHFGISLVEAMSAQAIPFALNAGGPREIITDGETGFLYDTVEMLSDLTVQIFLKSSKAQAQRIGRAAGDRARAFSTETFIHRVDHLVSEIT
jgi:glycosyltransferase involved in cell wall biosynthesis